MVALAEQWQQRLGILELIDADTGAHPGEPGDAIRAIFAAVARDLARPTFRGCAFHNASIEFADPAHPARVVARDYRQELHQRLRQLAECHAPGGGTALGAQLALILDGMYVSASHLGPTGPASAGPALVDQLLSSAHV